MTIKLGIVGVGKIARDQHLPVIAANKDYQLVAAASRHATVDGVKNYPSLAAMLAGLPEVDAVSLCTPPIARAADARLALKAGKHVMLEKPPGATLSEVHELIDVAAKHNVSLFATWHSRCAAGVAPAKGWLKTRAVRSVEISWREDIRVWHPGQDWILEPGGLGIFDPGVNALSIVTEILPLPFALQSGRLEFPANRQAPIAADLHFADSNGAQIHAVFDFLQTGPQTWDIRVETDNGTLALRQGGSLLFINGEQVTTKTADILHVEYVSLYERFAALTAERQSDVDLAPLRHAADAFMLGERAIVAPFSF